MDLNYSDDQLMLRESAERFLRDKYSFEHFRKVEAAGEGFGEGTWSAFAELGWLGLPLSEAHGGLGAGAVEAAIVCESLGNALVLEPYIPAVVLCGGLIDRLGTRAQCDELLGPLIEGRGWACLAHQERTTGDDLGHVGATAAKEGSGYVLDGAKTMVLGGARASTFLVSARVAGEDPQGRIGVFIVSAQTKGVTVTTFRTVDGGRAADVTFANVRVGQAALLGDSEDASAALSLAFDSAAAAMCWDAVGAMDALLSATVAFTKQRVQFGKPLSSFQALQHRMAEMAVKCTEARASALLASLSLNAPQETRARGVSGAKAKIGRISRLVAQEAIQLHGAMGFSDEFPVGWWFKRLFMFEAILGTTAQHLDRYRKLVINPCIQAESLLRAPTVA